MGTEFFIKKNTVFANGFISVEEFSGGTLDQE
jgi:hypothetical protein